MEPQDACRERIKDQKKQRTYIRVKMSHEIQETVINKLQFNDVFT